METIVAPIKARFLFDITKFGGLSILSLHLFWRGFEAFNLNLDFLSNRE